jgi:hypothetical protein
MNFRILLAAAASLLASSALTFAQFQPGIQTRPSTAPQQPGAGVIPNQGGRFQGAPGSALPTLRPGSSIGPGAGSFGNTIIVVPTPVPVFVPTNPTPPINRNTPPPGR